MTRDIFDQMVQKATDAGLTTSAYSQTWLINCTDCDGVVQSFYTTNGTAVFRDGNGRNAARVTVRNMNFDRFIELCVGETADILEIYF